MLNKEEEQIVDQSADDLIQELNEIKSNMVDKDKYEKIIEENNKLKKALIHGTTDMDVETRSSSELTSLLSNQISQGVTNVEGFKTVLELRESVIEETGKDPFMTEALDRIDPDFGDRVANTIQDLLDKSEGKPQMFNALLSQTLR